MLLARPEQASAHEATETGRGRRVGGGWEQEGKGRRRKIDQIGKLGSREERRRPCRELTPDRGWDTTGLGERVQRGAGQGRAGQGRAGQGGGGGGVRGRMEVMNARIHKGAWSGWSGWSGFGSRARVLGDGVGRRCCACLGERIAHKKPSSRPTPLSHRCGPAAVGTTSSSPERPELDRARGRRADAPPRDRLQHGRAQAVQGSSLTARSRRGEQRAMLLRQGPAARRTTDRTLGGMPDVASGAGPGSPWVSRGKWGPGDSRGPQVRRQWLRSTGSSTPGMVTDPHLLVREGLISRPPTPQAHQSRDGRLLL